MARFWSSWQASAIVSSVGLIAALMPPHWRADSLILWLSGGMGGIALERWAHPDVDRE